MKLSEFHNAEKIPVAGFYVIKYTEEDKKNGADGYGRLFATLENGDIVEVEDYDQYYQHHAHLTLVKPD